MTRMITHRGDCQPKLRSFQGEHVKQVFGKLKKSCYCDFCGKPMEKGEEAAAISFWADYGGISYYPWEGEYIEKNK